MANGDPLAIAGLWRQWKEADGSQSLAFTMLTVNAAEHPLMNRFHKPGDEKRSVVIVPTTEHANWLSCKSADEARALLQLYPVEAMHAEADPLPLRKPKAVADDETQSLFCRLTLLTFHNFPFQAFDFLTFGSSCVPFCGPLPGGSLLRQLPCSGRPQRGRRCFG